MARGSTIGDILKVAIGVLLAVILINIFIDFKNKTPSEDSVSSPSSEEISPLPEESSKENFEELILFEGWNGI